MSIDHYENFPVASILCPPALRPPIVAIYRFARTADDLADEGEQTVASRLETLAQYRACLDAAARTGAQCAEWPEIFLPLAREIQQHALPLACLHSLLDAFVQDCANPIYTERAQLLAYCERSANPIGRLLLHLYGINDPTSLRQSDDVCTALQLINFWQDPSVDLPRGRSYFTARDLQQFGLTQDQLMNGRDTVASRTMIADLCSWAEQLMLQGSALALRLPGRAGWELRLVVQGGLRILERIKTMEYRTLSARPTLRVSDLPVLAWRAMRMKDANAAAETAR